MPSKSKLAKQLGKTLTFRIMVIVVNSMVVWIYTKEIMATMSVMTITTITSTVLYFIHERFWDRVHWGEEKAPLTNG